MPHKTSVKEDIAEMKITGNQVNSTTSLTTFASEAGGSCGIGVLLQTAQ